jgi:dienelactone hydrolase
VHQAAAEVPAAVDALRSQFSVSDDPVGLVGGSAGGAVALLVLAEGQLPVGAAAVINPVASLGPFVAVGERMYDMTYSWTEESRAVADRLDFAARAPEIGSREPQPPVLIVSGADDETEYREAVEHLRDALREHSADPELVGFVSVPGMAHALAEEPGVEPAPQTAEAKQVDEAVTAWFQRHL